MRSLYEKYRPAAWGEVLGQDKVVKGIAALRDRGGFAGRAYWFSGKSGSGKTTIARLIAMEVCENTINITEIDAGELTLDILRRFDQTSDTRTLFGSGMKALIVNEAHRMKTQCVTYLLNYLEKLTRCVVVIFTTTNDGQADFFEGQLDANPLLSRCLRFSLAQRGLAQVFAERCHEIATKEGLNGRPIADYVKLANRNQCNMRAMLQEIEAGYMLA